MARSNSESAQLPEDDVRASWPEPFALPICWHDCNPGMTRRSSIDAYEAATDLARRAHAECYELPGPVVCDSEAGRDTLVQQPMMREVHLKTQAADIALVSVGGVDSGTIRRSCGPCWPMATSPA